MAAGALRGYVSEPMSSPSARPLLPQRGGAGSASSSSLQIENDFSAMNTRLKIAKLADATDAAHIEKALEAVPRVNSVRVEPDDHQAVVEHDGADETELTAAVKQLGYVATVE